MSEPTTTPSSIIQLPEIITVGEFAGALDLPVSKVIGELMKGGVMASINEQIDFDTAAIIGAELGFTVEPEPPEAEPELNKPSGQSKEAEATRPPVVAIMGHVDHGKTSLLDAIRSSSVAKGEAGGITQHIGAYQIKRGERWITFLDTPGHEAFSAIRAHGARMTDVAVIVVAADDGVKPQTKEALKYATEAGVQIVIAINKIDKEGADVNRVKQELNEIGLVPEEWGGKTVMVEVSATTGKNIDALLDLVLLVADIEELRARPSGPAEGVVIESHLDTGRGPVATLLVQNGILHVGDAIVSGDTYAKVRSLDDYRGKRIKEAAPGMPAAVAGFRAVPAFGNRFYAARDEKAARDKATASRRNDQVKSLVKVKKIGLEELKGAITAGQVKELNVIVKADVQGSLESLQDSLDTLRNEEVAVKVVASGVGDIGESDVTTAKTAGALLLGFNVGISAAVKQLANREQVKVQIYKVIYELLDDLRDLLEGLLTPETVETTIGALEVLGVFKTTKTVVICGGLVKSGKVEPKVRVRIKDGTGELGTGTLTNLQKDKQDAKEVFEGEQCGLSVATTSSIAIGNTLEFFTTESRARHL